MSPACRPCSQFTRSRLDHALARASSCSSRDRPLTRAVSPAALVHDRVVVDEAATAAAAERAVIFLILEPVTVPAGAAAGAGH